MHAIYGDNADYYKILEEADSGDYQPYDDFVQLCNGDLRTGNSASDLDAGSDEIANLGEGLDINSKKLRKILSEAGLSKSAVSTLMDEDEDDD